MKNRQRGTVMKQSTLYITTIALLLLTACSFMASADEGQKKNAEPYYDIEMKTDIVEYEEYHMTTHYPQTINNQINQTIKDYINQRESDFKQMSYHALSEGKESPSHELHIDFEVLHQDGFFFVVRFTEKIDVGQEPIVSQEIMNFEKKSGNQVTNDQLFEEGADYSEALAEWTKEKVSASLREEWEAIPSLQATPENYENVAWTDQGLMLYMPTSQDISVEGVLLDQPEIRKWLHSDYQELFLNTEPQAEPSDREASKQTKGVQDLAVRKSSSQKRIALTFDDGPHPEYTRQVLDVLAEHDAKATFFMIGKRVRYYPETAREVAEQGHEIGNHTWDHPRLTGLEQAEVEKQISAAQSVIKETTGETPSVIRYPFGEKPLYSEHENLETVEWTSSVENWNEKAPDTIATQLLSDVEDGSVLLMYDLHPSMIEALEIVVERLADEGYQFVTVSEL
ncbi:hypothetical protein EQV77_07780 [Halobacillus fulvus]|nr:hypothetical protein EQV77_07780 [Halobacillus fulvus]